MLHYKKIYLFPRLYILLLPLLALSGCYSEYIIRAFMDGPQVCLPLEMNTVMKNKRRFFAVYNGYNRPYVQSIMQGTVVKTEILYMKNNATYYADYYQLSVGETCGGKTPKGTFEAIYYFNNTVIGKGNQFYQRQLANKLAGKKAIFIKKPNKI